MFLYFANIAYLLGGEMGKLVDMSEKTFTLGVDALEVFVSGVVAEIFDYFGVNLGL